MLEPELVTHHEIAWVDGHEPPQDLFRPDPISLSGRHECSVHIYKILVTLRDIPPTPPRPLTLIATRYRHL